MTLIRYALNATLHWPQTKTKTKEFIFNCTKPLNLKSKDYLPIACRDHTGLKYFRRGCLIPNLETQQSKRLFATHASILANSAPKWELTHGRAAVLQCKPGARLRQKTSPLLGSSQLWEGPACHTLPLVAQHRHVSKSAHISADDDENLPLSRNVGMFFDKAAGLLEAKVVKEFK